MQTEKAVKVLVTINCVILIRSKYLLMAFEDILFSQPRRSSSPQRYIVIVHEKYLVHVCHNIGHGFSSFPSFSRTPYH